MRERLETDYRTIGKGVEVEDNRDNRKVEIEAFFSDKQNNVLRCWVFPAHALDEVRCVLDEMENYFIGRGRV